MEEIELVIKLPRDVFKKTVFYREFRDLNDCITTIKALEKAVPLPKGHGRLIDADEFLKENKDYTGWVLCSDAWGGENAYKDTLEDLINEAPTIIGADRAESEKEE